MARLRFLQLGVFHLILFYMVCPVAPLRPAEGAVIVDTSELGIDEVVNEVLAAMGVTE